MHRTGAGNEVSLRTPQIGTVVSTLSDNERMTMKSNIATSFPLVLIALASPAMASDYTAIEYTDSASVVSSVPVYQTVNEPQQQCWTETVTSYEERRSPGGVILGGVA